jgi:hypothetical protein
MRTRVGKYFAAGLLAMCMLACSFINQLLLVSWGGPQTPVDMLTQYAEPVREITKCNATKQLKSNVQVTRIEINEFGTRLCEFNTTIENRSPRQAVWVFAYRREADIWAKTNEAEWVPLGLLEAGGTRSRSGYHSHYSDPDATGSTLLRIEKIAGIYDLPECLSLRSDTDSLAVMAKPLAPACGLPEPP